MNGNYQNLFEMTSGMKKKKRQQVSKHGTKMAPLKKKNNFSIFDTRIF